MIVGDQAAGPGLSMSAASFDQSKERRFMICERIVRIAPETSPSLLRL